MEIVVNRCFGGFGLSHKAVMRYAELAGFKLYPYTYKEKDGVGINSRKLEPYTDKKDSLVTYFKSPLNNEGEWDDGSYWSYRDLERTDPILVMVVKELGKEADGRFAILEVVSIPDDIEWEIYDDYKGQETIHEKHRSW